MATPTTQVFSGARAIFASDRLPGDGKIGYAAGCSASESIEYEPVEVLDLITVKEFVPTAYRCTLSAQIFRVINNSVKAMTLFPKLENILTSGDMNCSIRDRITGKTMAQFMECKMAEQSWDITSRGIVSSNCNFVVKKILDESEIDL